MIEHVSGFHIEPTNICTLKCPGCARTRFLDQWPQHWKTHSLNIDDLINFLDIPLKNVTMNLCGNYGDPIYHKDFLLFVQKLKQKQTHVIISTNGSYRTIDWWQQLVGLLDAQDLIIFSIDGMPENFHQYRINGDWNSIEQGIKICAEASVSTHWKYIPFKYNVDSIQPARQLSQQLGMDQFVVVTSDRFDQDTEWLMPDIEHVGSKYQTQTAWKEKSQQLKIQPACANNREHFITADGFYTPCCYTADHRFYYKNQFGKNRAEYNIKTHTISEILTRPQVVDFYQNLEKHAVCQYTCPKLKLVD